MRRPAELPGRPATAASGAPAAADEAIGPVAAPPALAQLFLVVFLPFAAGYFLSFMIRSVNAIIAPQLIAEFDLSSARLGSLTAAFFLGFGAAQIPLGLLLDRFGARFVQSVLFLLGALGAAAFALAGSPSELTLGRALIGVGMAGGLMASLKAMVQWFPSRWLGLVNGCFLACGGLGALAATTPLAWLLTLTSWRTFFWGFAAALVLVAAWIRLVVPEGPDDRSTVPLAQQLREFAAILRDGFFWRVAPISAIGMGSCLAIQTLWAGPWLIDAAGLSLADAATRLLAMTAAMTLGFVLIGIVADALRIRGISPVAVMGATGALYAAGLALVAFHLDPAGFLAWIIIGLFGNGSALVYPLLARHFGSDRAGRANTANSLLVFGGAFLLQYGMGALIGISPRDAAGHYPPEAYGRAYGAVLVLLLLSLVPLLFHPRKPPA